MGIAETWQNVIDIPLPKHPAMTEERVKEISILSQVRGLGGSMRVATGRILTVEKIEYRRQEAAGELP